MKISVANKKVIVKIITVKFRNKLWNGKTLIELRAFQIFLIFPIFLIFLIFLISYYYSIYSRNKIIIYIFGRPCFDLWLFETHRSLLPTQNVIIWATYGHLDAYFFFTYTLQNGKSVFHLSMHDYFIFGVLSFLKYIILYIIFYF